MGYLVDTHILLWATESHHSLSKKVRDIFLDDEARLFVSIASIWEITIKVGLQKLRLDLSVDAFVNQWVLGNGMELLGIKVEHLVALTTLPYHHRDPFDRLLISQAKSESLTVLTADKSLKKYKIPCIF